MREIQIVGRGATVFIKYKEKRKEKLIYTAVLERGRAASNNVLQGKRIQIEPTTS